MGSNEQKKAWIGLKTIEADIMDKHLMPYLRSQMHPEHVDDALSNCFPEEVRPQVPQCQDMFDWFVLPWVLFNWIPLTDFDIDPKSYSIDNTPVENFLLHHRDTLSHEEYRLLNAASQAHHSYYRIDSISGCELMVTDMLLNTQHQVIEGQTPYTEGDIVLARRVSTDTVSALIQAVTIPLPKEMEGYVLNVKEDLLNDSELKLEAITKETLRNELALPLLHMYWHPFLN